MSHKVTYITLNDMEFYAYHGCYAEEQAIGNHFTVQLRLGYDASRAAVSDRIEDALNYVEVYDAIHEEMQQTSHLLEHVAARMLSRLMRQFPQICLAEVTVRKHNPPMQLPVHDVAVTMQTQRE